MAVSRFGMFVFNVFTSIFGICSLFISSFCYSYSIDEPQTAKAEYSTLTIVFMWILIISMCIPIQILEHMRNMDPFNYFCLPFTTSLSADSLMLSRQMVMVIFDLFLVMICIVSYSYLLVFITKQKRIEALKSVSKRKEKLQKFAIRMAVLILSTSFTWVPVLVVQILVVLQVTITPDIYLWCLMVAFPVNLIIDPVLLIRTMII